MKQKSEIARLSFKAKVAFATLALAVLAMLAPPPAQADSQGMPTTMVAATNIPAIVTTSTYSNNINSFIPIYQGKGLAIQSIYQWSATTAGNNVMVLAPTVDGTNYATTNYIVWITPSTGSATNQVATTNWARGTLDGFQGMFILTISNTVSGTLTNKGVTYSVPNS